MIEVEGIGERERGERIRKREDGDKCRISKGLRATKRDR